MRTIHTTVYKFDELTEEAKYKALNNLYDINIDYDWWDSIYEDAKMVGIKINGFDIDRSSYCQIEQINTPYGIATKILEEHGKGCDTYKYSECFIKQWEALVSKYSDGVHTDKVTDENEYDFDNEADELEREYMFDLSDCYLNLLRNEYEYRTSEQGIIETIHANEYEFTEDGKLI